MVFKASDSNRAKDKFSYRAKDRQDSYRAKDRWDNYRAKNREDSYRAKNREDSYGILSLQIIMELKTWDSTGAKEWDSNGAKDLGQYWR